MVKFKKSIRSAYRDYFLTLVRNDGRREQWYLPHSYLSEQQAQAAADEKNKHYKHGQLVVEYVDRPESIQWSGTLRL
jgi:hypothetical protein